MKCVAILSSTPDIVFFTGWSYSFRHRFPPYFFFFFLSGTKKKVVLVVYRMLTDFSGVHFVRPPCTACSR